jgi:hypothetical protein
VRVLEQALEVMVQTGDRYGEARARRDLGGAFHALGKRARARRCWQEALAICEALRAPETEELRALLAGEATAGAPGAQAPKNSRMPSATRSSTASSM